MLIRKIALLAFTAMVLLSCKETKTNEGTTQSKMEAVVAVHDELMPKMSTIGQLIGKLESSQDTLHDVSKKEQAIVALKEANKSMMDWMKDFGKSFDSEEILKGKALSEEKEKLLVTFEKSVADLKEQMNTAIQDAESLLE